MRLTVIGSSGTAPRLGNPASGYLVQGEGATIWMDAGPGTYMELLRLVDPGDVDAVLLSHMHPDHCSDVFALYHELAYIRGSDAAVPVIGPEGSIERVRGFVGGAADHAVFTTLSWREPQPGVLCEIAGLGVVPQTANHSIPAFVYRIESPEGALGYTGDTGPSEVVREHLEGCDTIVAEATMQDHSDPYPFHMTARQAGQLAMGAGARRLVLTHIPGSLDPADSLRQASEAFGGEIVLALPGDVFSIGG